MEEAGDVELDLRFGLLRAGADGAVVLPDAALDIGVNRRLEVDLDAQAGLSATARTWQAQDQLWLSAKHLLVDWHAGALASAVGLQHGPRFAVMPETWGFGYQALALYGLRARRWQGVISFGGYIDPQDTVYFRRPRGALGGLDWAFDLDDVWDLAPSLALTVHAEGRLDAVVTLDCVRDLGAWGSARIGLIGGWQDAASVVGVGFGYAPRVSLARGRRGAAQVP